jgi:uncharacterized protein
MFFEHVDKPMRMMAKLLKAERPPAEIMHWYALQDDKWRAEARRVGRNEVCPCGSGRKVKHCHGG